MRLQLGSGSGARVRVTAIGIDVPKTRRRWSRWLLIGLGVLLLASVAAVYTGTFLQARVGFPACSRSLGGDDSAPTQHGYSSMRWLPPAVRCSYPADPEFSALADTETHFATFGAAVMGAFIAIVVYGAALGIVPDPSPYRSAALYSPTSARSGNLCAWIGQRTTTQAFLRTFAMPDQRRARRWSSADVRDARSL
jgi:hypothetical protein